MRRRRPGVALLAGLLGLLMQQAVAHGPHVHGEAALNVAVEDDGLHLELVAPADSLLGFERPPRNAQEAAVLAAARARLEDGGTLFRPLGDCRLDALVLDDPFTDTAPADQDGHAGHRHDEPADTGHRDFVLRLSFVCSAAPGGLELALFDSFDGLERVRAQVLTATAQSAAVLRPRQPVLRW